MKTNKNGVKLLAAIMVFAMAFAGIVIISDDNAVDAATDVVVFVSASGDDTKGTGEEDTPFKTIETALNVKGVTTIKLASNYTIDNVTIKTGVTLDNNGKVLSVGKGVVLNGTLALDDRENIQAVAEDDSVEIALSSSSAVKLGSGMETVELLGPNSVTLKDVIGGDKAQATVTKIENEHGFTIEVSAGEIDAKQGYLSVGDNTNITINEGVKVNVKGDIKNSGTVILDGEIIVESTRSLTMIGDTKFSTESDGKVTILAGGKYITGLKEDGSKTVIIGTDSDSGAWIQLTGASGSVVLEKNVIGSGSNATYGIKATLNSVDATLLEGAPIAAENKLVIGSGSTLTVTSNAVSGAVEYAAGADNTNALADAGKFTLNGNGYIGSTDGKWKLANGESDKVVLTLNGYNGKQYFDGAFTDLVANGNNTITIVSENATVSAIKTSAALTMSGGKLTVNYTNTASSGLPTAVFGTTSIEISGMELTVYANATSSVAKSGITHGIETGTTMKITNGSIVNAYAGNKALWGHNGITIEGGSVVTAGAFEKAVRTNETVAIKGGSTLNAIILDGEGVNDNGVDDRFGIKMKTISVDKSSKVITQGLRATAEQVAVDGVIIVSGDYEQMISQKPEVYNAGLAVKSDLKTTLTVTEISDVKDAVAGFNILEGTDVSGDVKIVTPTGEKNVTTVTGVDGTVPLDENIVTNVATGTVSGQTIGDNQNLVILGSANIESADVQGTGVLKIVANQGTAVNATITTTIGTTTQTITFTDFKGTVTITVGSIVLEGQDMQGLATIEGDNTLKLSGSIAAGKTVTISLAGGATTGTVLILEDGKLTIPSDSTLVLGNGIKMSNDGQIVGGGTINVSEKAQFYTSNPVSVNFTGTGQIILEDATETLKLSDKLASSMTTEPTQKVIVTGNLTIKENQYLVITGDLEIPEGVTVTIENGGQLRLTSPTATATIAGTIKSLGVYTDDEAGFKVDDTVTGDVIITGEIIVGKTVENKTTVNIDGYAYLEGTITVNAKTIANFGKLEVAEAGIVTVKGTITGEIYNQGTVVIDGAVDNATIYNQAVTAVVKIDSLSSGTLTVSDAGLYLQTIETQRYYVAGTGVFDPNAYKSAWKISENAIEFTNVEGITVTESMKYKTVDDERLAVNHMEIQGAVTVSNVKDAPANPVMTITKGTVDVIETLDISKAQVSISDGAALVVYGTVNLDDSDMPNGINDSADIEITVDGYLYVYGLVRCIDIPVNASEGVSGYVEAVAYEIKEGTKTIYYYTNLADAIASGVKDLEVLGNLTILKDTTIPAGIEIDAAGSDVLIGKGDITEVTLTVADGGYLAFNKVTVNGTFVIENTDDGVNKMTNITSDTSVISENTAMYTNLLNALNSAESGEVRITKIGDDPVVLGSSATVKKDVTLVVPSSKKLSIVNGVTLTIDGILKLDGEMNNVSKADNDVEGNGFFTQTAEAERPSTLYSVVKVNGTIISASPLTYGNGPVESEGYKTSGYNIPGAQFEYKTKYYLTTIEQAAPVIKTVDASTIKIYGDNKVGTVAFEGTSMMPAAVKVYGNITAESFTIAFGEIYIDSGVAIEGTFGSSVGTITVKNMKVNGSLSMTDTVVTINDEEVQKVYVKGYAVTNKADVAPSLTFNGKVEVYKNDFSIDTTYNTSKYGSVTIAEDATVTVSGDNTDLEAVGSASKITVNGELITTNDGNVKSKTLVVMGTLDVREAQGSITAGKIDVTNLYIGGTTSDVTAVGGAAAVNAPVSGVGVVYLFPGSTVTGTLSVALESEDAVFTEFYVEDALWLTVYNVSGIPNINIVVKNTTENSDGTTTTTYKYNFKPLTIKEKEFKSWQYMSSGKLTNFANTTAIGEKEKVYADIKYDVYDITVYACEGIDDVYVDGVIMTKTILANLFTASVVAGEHTISYTLTNGYSGTATMYIDDKAVSGLKFTAEGDFSTTSSTIEYTIKLQGIEKSGYVPESPDVPAPTEPTEDEGLGITEYLLIVLVVLAAILVVVVAIRMMRS